MDKTTLERLGIERIEKSPRCSGIKDDMAITVNLHNDGAIALGYSKDMATIIAGNINENYINFGYSPKTKYLYMWGEQGNGFSITKSASKTRVYTQTKILKQYFKDVKMPCSFEVEFDVLAKCYYIDLTKGVQ